MKKTLAAAIAATAMSFAGSASATIVWSGQAVLWDSDLNTAGISVAYSSLPSFEAGTKYQVHVYGDRVPLYGGLQVWQFFHYHHEHYDQPDWIDGNAGDYVQYLDVNSSNPSIKTLSNGFIAYASVPKNIDLYFPDGHFEQWHWAWPTVEVIFDEAAIGKTFTIDISAVPEPSSWAMLITGFAAVGSALRSRRRSLAF